MHIGKCTATAYRYGLHAYVLTLPCWVVMGGRPAPTQLYSVWYGGCCRRCCLGCSHQLRQGWTWCTYIPNSWYPAVTGPVRQPSPRRMVYTVTCLYHVGCIQCVVHHPHRWWTVSIFEYHAWNMYVHTYVHSWNAKVLQLLWANFLSAPECVGNDIQPYLSTPVGNSWWYIWQYFTYLSCRIWQTVNDQHGLHVSMYLCSWYRQLLTWPTAFVCHCCYFLHVNHSMLCPFPHMMLLCACREGMSECWEHSTFG